MGSLQDTRRICEGCQRWVDKNIETRYCFSCEITKKLILKILGKKDEDPEPSIDLTEIIRYYRGVQKGEE